MAGPDTAATRRLPGASVGIFGPGDSVSTKRSAGLLLFRGAEDGLEVLLVHPGGPFWRRKDDGAWSIPKGEFEEGEDPFRAALRECREEIGAVATGEFIPLDPLRQPSGKVVYAWAVNSEFEPSSLVSNTFSMEWPPKSGQKKEFPEVDRAQWFGIEGARRKILKGQVALLDQFLAKWRLLEREVQPPKAPGIP